MKTCLTIAGSDSSGGAGIQADLKTFAAHRVFGMSAITALTAQNTLGVHSVMTVDSGFVKAQIDAVFDDIRPNAVKIGMLANVDNVKAVANRLSHFKANNVVLDPVIIATSGTPLLNQNAIRCLIDELIPHTDIITPNIAELITLCDAQGIKTVSPPISDNTIVELSNLLLESLPLKENGTKISILSKGGHLNSVKSNDYLLTQLYRAWLTTDRIQTNNNHGTGCTLSAAISANLALGEILHDACVKSKNYLTNALTKQLNLGKGNGPLNHC